jgi:hypothetical protein
MDIPIIAGKDNLNMRGMIGSVPILFELTRFKKSPSLILYF